MYGIKSIAVFLFSIVLPLHVLADTEKQVYSWEGKGILIRDFLVPQSEFRLDLLEKRFRKILEQNSARYQIIQIKVDTDKEKARRGINRTFLDNDYKKWEGDFERYSKMKNLPAEAELLYIFNSAVMRIRDAQGKIVKKVIQGKNPLTINSSPSPLELIYLAAIDQLSRGVQLNFYFLGRPPLKKEIAREVARQLRDLLQRNNIRVRIRLDPWFI